MELEVERLNPKNLSVVMPCLNEEETLEDCISEIRKMAKSNNFDVEIIVADNGSTDSSLVIARQAGVKIVQVETKGYGAAINAGIIASSSEYVLVGDSDLSYNFGHAPRFIEALQGGADLVMGNRFKGQIFEGAMPRLHRYLGNPILSLIARVLFRIPVGDFHCGLRAIKKSAYIQSAPTTTGMEFATEMVIRMSNIGSTIAEVPTDLRVDGRTRKPHLRSFPDGWRHLKLMLLYSPKYLQIYPGMTLFTLGAFGSIEYILTGKVQLVFAVGSLQSALLSLLLIVIGSQLFVSGSLNAEYAKSKGVKRFDQSGYFVLFLKSRLALISATALFVSGCLIIFPLVDDWINSGYSYVEPLTSSRQSFAFVLTTVVSLQIFIGSLQIRQFTSEFW